MKMKKISLRNVTAKLTRDEMRQIMAGSDGGCQQCHGNGGLINCTNDNGTCRCPGTSNECHQ